MITGLFSWYFVWSLVRFREHQLYICAKVTANETIIRFSIYIYTHIQIFSWYKQNKIFPGMKLFTIVGFSCELVSDISKCENYPTKIRPRYLHYNRLMYLPFHTEINGFLLFLKFVGNFALSDVAFYFCCYDGLRNVRIR